MNLLRKHIDLVVLITVLLLTMIVLELIHIFGDIGLWGILIVLVLSALFSSYRFFKTKNKLETFFHFFAVVILLITIFTDVYRIVGLCCDSEGNVFKPSRMDAWYFSIVTWTTLGYGDLRPPDVLKPFAMAQALLGQLFMAMIVGKTLFIFQKQAKGEKDNAS